MKTPKNASFFFLLDLRYFLEHCNYLNCSMGACLIVFVIADVFMPTLRPKQQTALPVDEKIELKPGRKKEGTQEIVGTNTKSSPGVGSEKLDLRTQSRLAAEVGHNVKVLEVSSMC